MTSAEPWPDGDFGDEAVVHLGRVHVVVLDLDAGIERLEILDQRLRGLGVERAVDDDLAFLVGGGDRLRVVGGIAGGHGLGERGAGGAGGRESGKAGEHGGSSENRQSALPRWRDYRRAESKNAAARAALRRCLRNLVGVRGFEPPASTSRT